MDKVVKQDVEDIFPWDESGKNVNVSSKLTIGDFELSGTDDNPTDHIVWEELKQVFNEEQHKQFMDWMTGQGSYVEGVFKHDLERFLRNN